MGPRGFACIIICAILWLSISVNGQPDRVTVAFEISNIATVDLTTATFWLDLAIQMTFENGSRYLGAIRVGNRAGNPIMSNGPVPLIGCLRYWGQLQFVPNLFKFPFDSQNLEFTMTHPSLNASEWVWVPDQANSFINNYNHLIGWHYTNDSISVTTTTETYASDKRAFSQVRLLIFIRRTAQGGVQTLLSPSFALVMVFVSFWLPINEGITRIGMATSALISEVFIHVSLRNSALLNLNSLVIMDGFMILCYGVILCAILTNVIILVLLRGSESDKIFARRLGSRVRYVVWFFGPGVFTFLFFPARQLYIPFLCIILPSVIALGIRQLVIRMKRHAAKSKPIRKHPLISDTEVELQIEDPIDPEDEAPAPLVDEENNAQMRDAIFRENAQSNPNAINRCASFSSVSSSN